MPPPPPRPRPPAPGPLRPAGGDDGRGGAAGGRQYLVMLPLSIIMDIVRLVSYHAHGFIVFICVLQFVFKFMGLWYAYRLCKEWEAGAGSEYDNLPGGAPGAPAAGKADPFNPQPGMSGEPQPADGMSYQTPYQSGP